MTVYSAYPVLLGPKSPVAYISAGAVAPQGPAAGTTCINAAAYVPSQSYQWSSPPASTRWLATPSHGVAVTSVCSPYPTLATAPVASATAHVINATAPAQTHGVSLVAGSVSVGGRTFERIRELGSGSFGVVWEVRERTSVPESLLMALKCTTPARKDMLEASLTEIEILQQLTKALPPDSDTALRVPRYVAHGFATGALNLGAAPGQGQVLLAMSKLGGQPLDQWLYGMDEHCLKKINIPELLDGPLPNSQIASRDLASASVVVVALLSQMAPVFRVLSTIAFHRDVSAHNFLISEAGGQQQFAVLDFGLAVRARSWQQEWQSRNIAGDPRYFSPAAWMLLAYGHKYLEAHPDPSFKRQYKHRIDHYALGVLALEVLFALWQGPVVSDAAVKEEEDVKVTMQRQALEKARTAWRAYWADVMGLFQKFHAEGAVVVREMLARSQAISQLADELRMLCTQLRAAAALLPAGIEASVLKITSGLLDLRGSLSWEEVSVLLPLGPSAGEVACDGVLSKDVEALCPCSVDVQCVADEVPSPTSPGSRRLARSQSHMLKHRRAWTIDEVGRQNTQCPPKVTPEAEGRSAQADAQVDVPFDVEVSGQGNGEVQHAEGGFFVGGSGVMPTPCSQTKLKKFSHRRVWTVDEAVSLRRGLPQVGMSPGVAGDGDAQLQSGEHMCDQGYLFQ